MSNTLWVEAYRPSTLEGYIGNEDVVGKMRVYLEQQDLPHMLLFGDAGTGKTTLAKIMANGLNADVLYVNASDENNIEAVRTKIKSFASTVGFRSWKIVILDESDYLTPNAQAALRNLMETFSKTTRFILTCNYVERIIDPIQSRCQTFAITPPSRKAVARRIVEILDTESVTYELKDVATIINSGYPDIRRVINALQRQIVDGKLVIDSISNIQANYMTHILDVLKGPASKKDAWKQIRQIIADSHVKDFTALYRFLYDNLEEFAVGHVAPVILLLAEAQYQDSFVIDKEIHVSALFIKLLDEIK